MEWRFMYLLLGWFAATPALVAPGRRNRLLALAAGQLPRTKARSSGSYPVGVIHCALRAHLRASSGTRLLERNPRVTRWAILSCSVRRIVRRTVPSVAVALIGTSSCSRKSSRVRGAQSRVACRKPPCRRPDPDRCTWRTPVPGHLSSQKTVSAVLESDSRF